jgi:hypothetical protein
MKIGVVVLCFILCLNNACRNNTDNSYYKKESISSIQHRREAVVDEQGDTNRRQQINVCNTNYKLKIWQIHDSLHIVFQSKTKYLDTSLFNVPPSDFILPCEALEIISDKRGDINVDFRNYYLYKDTILLLPTLYTNGYGEYLWVINLYTNKIIEDKKDSFGFYRYTHLPCFLFNKDNGNLLTTNTIEADNPHTRVGIYRITPTQINHLRETYFNIPVKIYEDSECLKRIIGELSGSIRNKQ